MHLVTPMAHTRRMPVYLNVGASLPDEGALLVETVDRIMRLVIWDTNRGLLIAGRELHQQEKVP
jgi:hypothetical protein